MAVENDTRRLKETRRLHISIWRRFLLGQRLCQRERGYTNKTRRRGLRKSLSPPGADFVCVAATLVAKVNYELNLQKRKLDEAEWGG